MKYKIIYAISAFLLILVWSLHLIHKKSVKNKEFKIEMPDSSVGTISDSTKSMVEFDTAAGVFDTAYITPETIAKVNQPKTNFQTTTPTVIVIDEDKNSQSSGFFGISNNIITLIIGLGNLVVMVFHVKSAKKDN